MLGIGIGITAGVGRGGGGAWTPARLFANGEAGAWYDPSDIATLFQNAGATTPVTAAGQSVGLMFDRSHGMALGDELASSPTIEGVDIGGPGFTNYLLGFASKPGKTYRIEFDVVGYSGTGTVSIANQLAFRQTLPSLSSDGHVSVLLTAISVTNVAVFTRSTNTCDFENITAREVSGYHALQLTSNARPILGANGLIDFDGVNDELTTIFPDLGDDVTIVRAVPETGASITTGQTIGAGSWADSTDHHGLIIINRALTTAEAAAVTQWANKKAGVVIEPEQNRVMWDGSALGWGNLGIVWG